MQDVLLTMGGLFLTSQNAKKQVNNGSYIPLLWYISCCQGIYPVA